MFLHERIIGSLGEEKVIHMLEVKTDGGVRDRKDFLFFFPSCPDAKVLCSVVFHVFSCGPVSRATSANCLTKSSCWESKFQNKKLLAVLITPAPFLQHIMVAAFGFSDTLLEAVMCSGLQWVPAYRV